jgi:hypothetical protein
MRISEQEFERIVNGIYDDRAIILQYNPIGTPEETLLWMLLGCLISYLNLSEQETPCFPGKPNAETYHAAILFVLNGRIESKFEPNIYLKKLSEK